MTPTAHSTFTHGQDDTIGSSQMPGDERHQHGVDVDVDVEVEVDDCLT